MLNPQSLGIINKPPKIIYWQGRTIKSYHFPFGSLVVPKISTRQLHESFCNKVVVHASVKPIENWVCENQFKLPKLILS